MFKLFPFNSDKNKKRFGLVSCLNNRGLGTEARLLKDFFKEYLPEYHFDIFEIRAGRASKAFDDNWQSNKKFIKWLNQQDYVMTIEHFMPNLYTECKKQNIKSIWRPNIEWIDATLTADDFNKVNCIIAPMQACSDLLTQQFSLKNVLHMPWIANLPLLSKQVNTDKTQFLFNAGRGGIGDRRNCEAVIKAFSKVLGQRDDIEFLLKTQIELDISSLEAYKGKNFIYHHKNTSYKKNLAYYKNADFSIAPSKWEGVGFALLESLYHGTPVLTVDAPPMNQWITHKTLGYTVPASFADTDLPIEYNRDNLHLGLNWVKAAECSINDLVDGIIWLADNKIDFYKTFNKENKNVLNSRKADFIAAWKTLLAAE
ncbi:MAG: glycosyltransferase [Thalassotalea sp.]|nr:glycosyltransferase [Thalassotalea sp.]